MEIKGTKDVQASGDVTTPTVPPSLPPASADRCPQVRRLTVPDDPLCGTIALIYALLSPVVSYLWTIVVMMLAGLVSMTAPSDYRSPIIWCAILPALLPMAVGVYLGIRAITIGRSGYQPRLAVQGVIALLIAVPLSLCAVLMVVGLAIG